MSLILNIETATTVCSVALAKSGELLSFKEHNGDYTHSENLTLFIEDVVKQSNLTLKDLNAIAISMGPGSYTGLRIGVSVAKGLCYALDKPLIAVNTLQHLALSVSAQKTNDDNFLYCPMLDARRMEVYYSMFDKSGNTVMPIAAEIIDENSFIGLLTNHKILFFGNGAEKCKNILSSVSNNALFTDNVELSAKNMVMLSYKAFQDNNFENIFTFEPYYLKDFLIKKSK